MNKKKINKMANHPRIKQHTEKFASEIALLLTQQFEKAKAEADANGGEFKFDMNGEMKIALEEKGKQMSSFIQTIMEDHKKETLNRQIHRNHAVKVSIR